MYEPFAINEVFPLVEMQRGIVKFEVENSHCVEIIKHFEKNLLHLVLFI